MRPNGLLCIKDVDTVERGLSWDGVGLKKPRQDTACAVRGKYAVLCGKQSSAIPDGDEWGRLGLARVGDRHERDVDASECVEFAE